MKFVQVLDKSKEFFKFCRSNMTPKRTAVLAVVLVLFTSVTGYCIGLSQTSSESIFFAKLQKALSSKDPSNAIKYLTVENHSIKVSKENLDPFFQYIRQIPGRSKNFIEDLKKPQKDNAIAVFKNEKTLWGEKYFVELKPVHINLSTPYKGTEIYLNNKHIITTDKDSFTGDIGPLVPGIHSFKAVYKNQYGESSIEQTVLAISKKNNIKLEIEGRRLTISSNYPGAYVYLNGENTGKQVKDFKDIGPFPGDGEITAFVEKEFPWGHIKSAEAEITSTSKMRLDINPLTTGLKSQLEEAYTRFYKSLFAALSAERPDKIKYAEPAVKEKLYSKLKMDSFILNNSYSMKNVEYEQGIIAVKPEGEGYTASANITIEYKTSKSFLGINLPNSYKTITKKFKTDLTYVKSEDSWIVSAVNEL